MSLKQCCATGSLHSGTPTGRIEKFQGLDCYIADPPNGNPKGIVVIIPDAFGWELPNNRILADEYAKKGNFQVYLPDFMYGFVMPADMMQSMTALSKPGLWNQFAKIGHVAYMLRWFIPFMYYCREAVAAPHIHTFLRAVRSHSSLPLGVAGFCWGGGHVTKLCWDHEKTADGKRLVDCGFAAHPSFVTYPGDIEKIRLPYSCAAASIDPQMSAENAKQTEEILKAKTAKGRDLGVEHEFVMYEGASHGFAVRADEDNLKEAEQGKQAEAQAIAWSTRWFANPPPS